MKGLSFRFYGRSPADWFEGANDGHRYEIAFVVAPDLPTRKRIASHFERRLATGPARSGGAWLWSERFARFDVGERWLGAMHGVFGRIADVLVEVHQRIAPIAQVIFFGARERGTGAWDNATVAAQPVPDPGPPYDPPIDDRLGAYSRPTDTSLPVAQPDPEVEAIRIAERREILTQREMARIAKGSAKTPMSPFPADRVEAFKAAMPRMSDAVRAKFRVPRSLGIQQGTPKEALRVPR